MADDLPHLGSNRRAMIIYTSGTTGRPKGAVSTHQNIGAQIAALVEAWRWTPADRLLLALPLHHVHGIINGLGSALAVRATCEILPAFDAERVWDRLASGEITVFTAVPTIYNRLIASWDAAPPEVQRGALGRRTRSPADDVRFGGAAGADARALARDHRAHAARTLRHDRDRHGAVESARRRAAAGLRRAAAAGRRGPAGR